MKNIIKILFVSFIFFSCSNNPRIVLQTDLEKLRLKGNIKKIEKAAWEVELIFGEIEKTKPKIGPGIEPLGYYDDYFRELYFDKKGNILKSIWLDDKNLVVTSIDYFYDDFSRIVKQIDKDNNSEITTYSDEKFTSKSDRKYLNQSSPWEEICLKYYDINSNIIKEEIFKDKKLKTRTLFEFNNSGKIISKKEFNNIRNENVSGKLTSYSLYGYDIDGNLVTSLDSISPFKNSPSLVLYEYNNLGDVIMIYEPRVKFSNTSSYTYKYDENDNWIERIEYYGNENDKFPIVLTIRKIEYY